MTMMNDLERKIAMILTPCAEKRAVEWNPSRILRGIGKWSGLSSGPLQGALGSAAWGVGGGLGAGYLYNLLRGGTEREKKRRLRRWALGGGLLLGLPAAGLGASSVVHNWNREKNPLGVRSLIGY